MKLAKHLEPADKNFLELLKDHISVMSPDTWTRVNSKSRWWKKRKTQTQ